MNVKPNTWTIAYRKPRANRFQRVTNWHGTWNDAYAVARMFAEMNPELQVFYVPTLESENAEDAGTVLVDSGKRVRIIDNGALTGDVLDYAVSRLWEDASEENACIDEAYAGKAEDANMSIPAYRACLTAHKRNGEIFLSGLWNTPIAHMHKVVTFDDGSRYGVSNSDASFFTGEVTDMPKGEVSTCVHCKSVLLTEKTEEIVSEEIDEYAPAKRIERINTAIAFLTPMRDEAERAFLAARDGDNVAEDVVDTAYQVFADFDRSISEYRRTLAYLTDMVS